MSVLIAEAGSITIPAWVTTLDAFLDWRQSDGVPEKARVHFIDGEPWVDLSMEEIYSHADLKTEIASVLRTLARSLKLGRVLGDGVLIVNRAADLAAEPDAVFVSEASYAAGRVAEVEGKGGGEIALEGAPDVVVEVVSDSSVKKDTRVLLEKYFLAGIPEYWLVDARGEGVTFTIHRRGPKKYARVREQDGWVKSAAFGKSFRLVRGTDRRGRPEFTLEAR
ncbi:MAG: Uma2 family endonuclease [Gemmataceae bacterium]|nr:Uma2 family endonuclease [Gemmataceae bacterium]